MYHAGRKKGAISKVGAAAAERLQELLFVPRSIWNQHATLWTEVACKSHRNLILALCSMRLGEDVAENSRAQQSTIVANDKPIQKWHRHNQHSSATPLEII